MIKVSFGPHCTGKLPNRFQGLRWKLGRLLLPTACMVGLFEVHSGLLLAQTSSSGGRLQGTIVDASGGGVVGAAVTVRSATTGIVTRQSADQAGYFAFPNLPPGYLRGDR